MFGLVGQKRDALLLAAERGSLSKAADELGYAQSGMTYLINSLEEECGVPLLLRSWDGVRLSPEGEALRGRAENVALLPLAEPLYRRLGMNRPAGVPEGHALHTLLSLLRADPPAPADYPRKK